MSQSGDLNVLLNFLYQSIWWYIVNMPIFSLLFLKTSIYQGLSLSNNCLLCRNVLQKEWFILMNNKYKSDV